MAVLAAILILQQNTSCKLKRPLVLNTRSNQGVLEKIVSPHGRDHEAGTFLGA